MVTSSSATPSADSETTTSGVSTARRLRIMRAFVAFRKEEVQI
jgi:hypothetical protein